MNTLNVPRGFQALIPAAIIAVLGIGLSGVAAADESSVSVSVKVADLDISQPSGARRLYDRIQAAAQNACSYYWFKSDADEAHCIHDAIANAVTKVNRSELSAVYNAKYPTPVPRVLASQNR